ncbi:MAG: bifunctional metallophosphatase/5'-nucleotidase [Fimbriimonadales bacterium]|nr:MAG: bifunctional metallophosphatase/5'-nucleotidase [Fimbriimonadales bacterium]
MKRLWLTLSLLGLVLQIGFAADPSGRWFRLTILHTNDTHGHLLPFSYPDSFDSQSPLANMPYRKNIGGVARRATLIQQQREALQPYPALVIDAGDYMDGTPFSLEFQGEADVATLNTCGYDFATLGNHEFSNTLDQVLRLVQMSRFKTVCANLRDRTTGEPLVPPYVITQVGELRVALFGLVMTDTQNYRGARERVEVTNPFEVARALVPQLRQQADVVILISHLGIGDDERLAREVSGIDVIVGGHSHTRLAEPRFIEWQQKAPINLGGTVIVQAHQWGGELGRLDLLFWRDIDTNRLEIVGYKGQLIPITAEIRECPTTQRVLDRYWKRIAGKYGRIVGEATDDFVQRGDDYAHYSLVGDAVRSMMGVEFDLQNMFGVRIELARGPIRYYDLARMMPFGNTVIRFEITGRDLKRLLAEQRPTVSGIRYRTQNRQLVEATLNGQPIEDERIYKGTTNSYFAERALKPLGVAYVDTGKKLLDVVADYIRKQRRVSPSYDGRRVAR